MKFESKNKKYLIMSIIALSLSACGGGGGSGSGSSGESTGSGNGSTNVITRGDSNNNQTLQLSSRTVEIKGEIEGYIANFVGINVDESSNITNKAEVDVDGANSIGILSDNSIIRNYGEIDVDGTNSVGIHGKNNSTVYNYGRIKIEENSIGILGESNSNIINNGTIIYDIEDDHPLSANSYSVGIKLTNSTGENNGNIIMRHGGNIIKLHGVYVGENSTFTNKSSGNITVTSTQSGAGMVASGTGSNAKNEGTINVSGTGTYGMIATNGGTVINEGSGTINVSSTAAGGMHAGIGSTAINHGTINIDHSNVGNSTIILDKNGKSVPISAMSTSGGNIENYGNINIMGSVAVRSAYAVGTTSEGAYGKLSGDIVVLDSQMTVSDHITRRGYEEEYYLDGVVIGDEIKLGDNYQVVVDSLLYKASYALEEEKLGISLYKTGRDLSDFVSGPEKETALILDKYYTSSYYTTLNADAQYVIDTIDISTSDKLKSNLEDLTPSIYSTVTKEILDINRTFKNFEKVNINSLENDYDYVFNLMTEYQDISDRNNIEGYDLTLVGFVGTKKFADGFYATLGYGHTKLNYDSKKDGKINTIFLGLNKRFDMDTFNIDLGLSGEYNFHEKEREIDFLNRNVKSKYNSYLLTVNLEISKIYGEQYYFMPYTGIEVGIGKYDDIKEKNGGSVNVKVKGETFSTVTPKVGGKIGIRNGAINLYASAEYSYEMGNVDKKNKYSLESFDGYARLPDYDTKGGKGNISIGAEYKKGGINAGVSLGKKYESKGNNETFVKVNIGYRF